MFFVDFPFTGVESALAYKGVEPVIIFGIAGTLWWCLLGWLGRKLFRAYKNLES